MNMFYEPVPVIMELAEVPVMPPPPPDWQPQIPKANPPTLPPPPGFDTEKFVAKMYNYPVWPTICDADKPTIRPIKIIGESSVPKDNRKIAEWDGKFDRYIIFKNLSNPKYPPFFICPIPNGKSPLQYFGRD